MKRAFIEYDFPLKEVSINSAREKSIRHGHLSTLHIWWARRPLAASKTTIYASLVPEPKDEKERKEHNIFIAKLSEWKNLNNKKLIEKARQDILNANNGIPPKVLDPFSGGGSIPLEALRLGCETYASDLNPVAVMIERCTLEFPQKYGQPIPRKQYFAERNWMKDDKTQITIDDDTVNPLLEDVKYWSNYIFQEAKKELRKFYPPDSDGSVPVGYIWARTISCTNKVCKAEIPLMRQTWLAKKPNKKVAYKIIPKGNIIEFKILQDDKINFNPSLATVLKGNVICPCCNTGISAKENRAIFQAGGSGERMVIVVLNHKDRKGKTYRLAKERDYINYQNSQDKLKLKRQQLFNEWGIDPVPNELIHTPNNKEYKPGSLLYNFTPVLLYGLTKWGDLFNERQKLANIVFLEKISNILDNDNDDFAGKEYRIAVMTFVAFILDRLVDKNSNLVVYNNIGEKIEHVFGRQALPFVWDYVELNPFTSVGWPNMTDWVIRNIENSSKSSLIPAVVKQECASDLRYPDNYFDAIFTDPPYYDNIPYADLSDFFYVWLKRALRGSFPELTTPNTPKSSEIIAELPLLRGMRKEDAVKIIDGIKTKEHFELRLQKVFKEVYRILKPEGIVVIVYAHKSTDGWETVVNAILEAGLYLTGSWPINTEMQSRLRAKDSAALASSIYMVCRKRNTNEMAHFNEIKPAIENQVNEKLNQFWGEGVSGSDFFISAIGPAVEVFGKYASVEKLSGQTVSVLELLEYVRKIVSEYALSRILKSPQLGGVDQLTRFYLVWRWTFGNNLVPFDDGNKMALSIGIGLDEHWDKGGIIEKAKDKIKVKSHVERRKDQIFETKVKREYPQIDEGGGVPSGKQTLMLVDILQECLILWDRSDRTSIARLLEASGHRKNDLFWQVAQSISDVLPDGDKEKQTIQGFLLGKESYMKGEVPLDTKDSQQETIFGDA